MYQEILIINLAPIYMMTVKGKFKFSPSLSKIIFMFLKEYDDNMNFSWVVSFTT